MAAGPACSVIVPTRRRVAQLAACLESLAELDMPRGRFEVLVLDDGGGEPELDELVDSYGERLDVTLSRLPARGSAAARNEGARRARAALLVLTDDDCTFDRGWLAALERAAAPGVAVAGRTVNGAPNSVWAAAAHVIVDTGYAWSNRRRVRFAASNNLAFPRDGYLAVGGFDERYARSSDRDLCDAWLASGRRIVYSPDAVARHQQRLTLASFVAKHFANGRGVARFHRRHVERGARRVLPEPGYYAALLRAAAATRPGRRAPLVLGLVGLALGANYLAYVLEYPRGLAPPKTPDQGEGSPVTS
ncbi:MAG: hypothetical protein QOE36_156 [Gaiellaceae bacterium]|nr:hypothetical protein [Gaiellaceae bacterium]